MNNSFSFFDYWQAMQVCEAHYPEDKQALDAYLLRKRKQELCALVRRVIRDDLNEDDRRLLTLHWYEGKPVREIAELIGASRSTVFRRLERIEDDLFDKLKYAMAYRYGACFAADAKQMLKKDIPASLKRSGVRDLAGRLRALRLQSSFTKQQISDAVGVPVSRLDLLEKDGTDMTAQELKKLSSFFHVTTDRLVYGSDSDGAVSA